MTSAEEAIFYVGSGIESLALFESNFGVDRYSSDLLFLDRGDVVVDQGQVKIAILPNRAYTLSTVKSAKKGVTRRASPGEFPQSYTDDFDSCPLESIPRLIAPMAGAFDCVEAKGRTGRSVRQASPTISICDRGDVMPYAILGDAFRTTYNVSIDFLLPPSDSTSGGDERGVFVGARAKGAVGSNTAMSGIFLVINATGYRVALTIGNISSSNSDSTYLIEGLLSPMLKSDPTEPRWHRVRLSVEGAHACAYLDDSLLFDRLAIPAPHEHQTAPVGDIVVPLGTGGYAAFGTVGYTLAEFDNIRVDSL